MANVTLTATTETRDTIQQLIALERVANGKVYTIKTYLEYLVGLAAAGNIDQAGNIKIDVIVQPVDFRVEGAQLRAVKQVDTYLLRNVLLPDAYSVRKAYQQVYNTILSFSLRSEKEAEEYRHLYLGRKGRLTDLFDTLKDVPTEERREAGQQLNKMKQVAQARYDKALVALRKDK